MIPKSTRSTLQKWGNSLAVRIPVAIAKRTHLHLGSPVELSVHDNVVVIKPTEHRFLTLEERLKQYDPHQHGGEIMACDLQGREKF